MLCVEESVSISNEDLVLRLQSGTEDLAEQLIRQNEGWISKLAMEFCTQYDQPDLYEDLQQEGRIALLESARSYAAERSVKFLSYAGNAIRNAMLDYAAQNSTVVSLPPARFHQLRRVSYLCVTAQEDASQAQLMERLCQEMGVSPKVAAALLQERYAISASANLGDSVSLVTRGRDPAAVYETRLKVTSVFQAMERLSPREQLLINRHLGIGAPDGKGMTFEELAIRLNYNDPSGAEKPIRLLSRDCAHLSSAASTELGSRPSVPCGKREGIFCNHNKRQEPLSQPLPFIFSIQLFRTTTLN